MTQVKVCGLRSVPEARAALHAGADYLGFIFWKPGKRYIAPTDAAHIKMNHELIDNFRQQRQVPATAPHLFDLIR